MMKIIIFFTLLALAAADWRIQTHTDLMGYRAECVSSLDIPENLVADYRRWVFPNDEKTRCYIKCIFNKMGLFDDTTGPVVENLVRQLGQTRGTEEIRADVLKCVDSNPNKDDLCTYAFRGFVCFNNSNLELIQLSIKKD